MPFYPSLRDAQSYGVRATEKLLKLRRQIADQVPRRTLRDTLLLATWNIRDFDSNKFKHGPRLPESFHYIAEIISAFDIVAIQEVNEDLGPLERVMKLLGPQWDYLVTDMTEGPGGNRERMAFVFDKRKILFRKVAGEVVLPDKLLIGDAEAALPKKHKIIFDTDQVLKGPRGEEMVLRKGDEIELPKGHRVEIPGSKKLLGGSQFARTPYMASFQAGWFKFTLCTVHLFYGSDSGAEYKRRVQEIEAIGKFFASRADRERKKTGTSENYVLLGDFNIVDPEDDTMKALEANGWSVPQGVHKSNVRQDKFYDQIAFRTKANRLEVGPSTPNSGVFHFFDNLFTEADVDTYLPLVNRDLASLNRQQKEEYYKDDWRTWQMSDHFPLWVELSIDFSDEYLERVQKDLIKAAGG